MSLKLLQSRRALAAERARDAHAALARCRLCAHHCGVNRLRGELGRCRAGATARVFSAQTEVADELELVPTFAIALSGCDLRCDFCITGAESWNPGAGIPLDPAELATRAEAALANGARSIMILGGEPAIHLPAALQFAAAMPERAQLVWKTNAHCSPQARQFLDGVFDIWLADYKFGNDRCAHRLAHVPNYNRIVQENLLWAFQHSRVIVRHLVMPGHAACCWRPVAEWLSRNLPGVEISLRTGFWPAWHARKHKELKCALSRPDSELAFAIAREYNLNLIE